MRCPTGWQSGRYLSSAKSAAWLRINSMGRGPACSEPYSGRRLQRRSAPGNDLGPYQALSFFRAGVIGAQVR